MQLDAFLIYLTADGERAVDVVGKQNRGRPVFENGGAVQHDSGSGRRANGEE